MNEQTQLPQRILTPTFMQRWIEALKSGEYPKGMGSYVSHVLQVDGTQKECFCAMGVALKLLDVPFEARRIGTERLQLGFADTPEKSQFVEEIHRLGIFWNLATFNDNYDAEDFTHVVMFLEGLELS